MSIYLKPIITACVTFPFIAAIFTIPYMIKQYHKYGSLLFLRVIVVYTFIFYMMTSFFMTILPLPPIDSVSPSSATILLTPFDALRRAVIESGFNILNPSSYLSFFTNSSFIQIIFNILLLLPFGVYLRYYFNRKWYQVLILSFLYSLFFELTQLSGLYGIYPYPYRFFEVDDLICNTLGGMLGYLITPALLFFLPSRERLDQMSYKKGATVSATRRTFALFIDLGIVLFIYCLIKTVTPVFSYFNLNGIPTEIYEMFFLPVQAFIYFTVCLIIFRGYTPGKFIVKIRLVNIDGGRGHFYQYIARSFIVCFIFLPLIYYFAEVIYYLETPLPVWVNILLIITLLLLFIIFTGTIINVFKCFIKHEPNHWYDKLCHLNVISTVKNKDKSKENLNNDDKS